jgi:hypothetical protein
LDGLIWDGLGRSGRLRLGREPWGELWKGKDGRMARKCGTYGFLEVIPEKH